MPFKAPTRPNAAWWQHSACAGMDVNRFFPSGNGVNTALAVCARCPVIGHCRIEALDAGPDLKGVWGGMSEHERRRIHDRREALAATRKD